MRKALKMGGLVVGLLCAIVLGPWVILWALFVAEDISHDVALRRYKPTSLADAVAYKYATPDLVAGFIDRGADVNQKIAGGNGESEPRNPPDASGKRAGISVGPHVAPPAFHV